MKELLNSKKTLGGIVLLFLLIVGWQSARAQTSTDAAQDVNIETVNQKADNANNKANGVEQRVTALESLPTVDPSIDGRVTALEAIPVDDDSALDARVSLLESQPGGDPLIDQRVTDLEAASLAHGSATSSNAGGVANNDSRLTAIESSAGGGVWAIYNSLGVRLDQWANRADVGLSLINVNGFEIWAQCDADAVTYLGVVEPVAIRFKTIQSGVCSDPFVMVDTYSPLRQQSTQFFGGQVHGWVGDQKDVSPTTDGHLFAVDLVTPELYGGSFQVLDTKNDCVPGGSMPQSDIYRLRDHGALPDLAPPFTLIQE